MASKWHCFFNHYVFDPAPHWFDFSWKFGPLFQVSVGPAVQIHFKNESGETEEIPPHP